MTQDDAKTLIEHSADLTTTYLGTHTSRMDVEETVGVSDAHRDTHVLGIGATGTGKTQVMVHAALQDIYKGRGICFINPKGDATDQVLRKMPEDRLDDVIYINPARTPVTSINPLQPHVTSDMSDAALENQKEIIVGDILAAFKRQSQNWGDQWPRILSTLLRAHLDLNIRYDASHTLGDVLRCITDDDALSELIDQTDDPTLRSHLVDIRDNVSDHAKVPLHNRIQDFMANDVIRRVIDADGATIDFYDALTDNRIILVEVQRGEIGRNASPLIGSLVLTQVWAAAQARIALPPEDRDLFAVYVDEVKHYASASSNFDEILSEAREYGLGVWMTSQYLDQLDPDMQRAAINNCRTKLVFQPEIADDGTRIANMLVGVGKDTLKRLGDYRAALQTPDGRTRSAVTFDTFPPWPGTRDTEELQRIKEEATMASGDDNTAAALEEAMDLGPGGNAGDQLHTILLQAAQQYLEQRPEVRQVNLLHQEVGADRPDGEIIKATGDVANLEAEVSTVAKKPARVLRNLKRAVEQGRKCVFVVEESVVDRLKTIITDPVNRRGDDHADDHGTYSYYTADGEPFTAVDAVADAAYRILVYTDRGRIMDYAAQGDTECPELDEHDRETLETYCLYRDDEGFCEVLEQPCVLTQP